MDKALPSGGRDCGFESRLGLFYYMSDHSPPSKKWVVSVWNLIHVDYTTKTNAFAGN